MLFGQFAGKAVGTVTNSAVGELGSLFGQAQNGNMLHLSHQFQDISQRPEYLVVISKAGTSTDPKSPDRIIQVTGYLPEEFSYSFESHWEAPFSDMKISQVATMVTEMLGRKFVTQSMSSQFWTGSEHLDFNIRLVITAESGPDDLLQPLYDLYSLVLPSKDPAGFFRAPGPKLQWSRQLTASWDKLTGATAQAHSLQPLGHAIGQGAIGLKNDILSGISNYTGTIGSNLTGVYHELKKGFTFENTTTLYIGGFLRIPDVIIKNVTTTFKTVMTTDAIPSIADVDIAFTTHQIPTVEDIASWFLVQPSSIVKNIAPTL